MKTIQQILVRIKAYFICNHKWVRMRHHGLPNEPYFMTCIKCRRITKLDYLLVNKNDKGNVL